MLRHFCQLQTIRFTRKPMKSPCEISGSARGLHKLSGILRHYAVQTGKELRAFLRRVVLSPSGYSTQFSWTTRRKAIRFFKTSVNTYQSRTRLLQKTTPYTHTRICLFHKTEFLLYITQCSLKSLYVTHQTTNHARAHTDTHTHTHTHTHTQPIDTYVYRVFILTDKCRDTQPIDTYVYRVFYFN
jgi:hypothetical protein